MNLVFLGPPGAGKGTQAALLAEKVGIPHISTGDIFRKNLNQNTELGLKAKEYMNTGKLVPDDVTNAMVKNRLEEDDVKNGFILDGYPRTVNQAQFLGGIVKVDHAVYFTLPKKDIIKRIAGRRTCPKCQATYNIHYSPPGEEGVCDECGTTLVQREDEQPAIVEERIQEYTTKTEPVVGYYKQKGLLLTIDARASIEDIHKEVQRQLNI